MVISQTPFRMSFFGGGTDFPDFYNKYGGSVISTTFDKYCFVNVRHLPHFFDYNTELSYSKIERVKDINEIEHPAVREALKELKIHDVRMTYEADLPARSGLGTSSSFAVGMLNALHAMKGEYVSKRMLADEAIHLERELCREAGGIQDQIAASFGGMNRIDFYEGGYTVKPIIISVDRKQLLNRHLMLYFTGFSRFSSELQCTYKRNLKDKTNELKEMIKLVDDAERVLTSSVSITEFGKLLDYAWRIKRGMAERISTETIDSLYSEALKQGAIGGKLLGAGGGGFLLFFVEPDKQDNFKKAMKNLLYVPFEFENNGTRILYYNVES